MAEFLYKLTLDPIWSKETLGTSVCRLCGDDIFGEGYTLIFYTKETQKFLDTKTHLCISCGDETINKM